MKIVHSVLIAVLATAGATTIQAQTALRFPVNATTLGMESKVLANGSLQRYVDQWGMPASVGVAGGRWQPISGATINTLDYGIGKFGFRAVAPLAENTVYAAIPPAQASLGMDLEIGASCGGTDNAGQRGGISIKPVGSNATGIVRAGSSYMWQVDYVVTACSSASQIMLRAHNIAWVYGRKSPNIPVNPQYTYNGEGQTTIKLGDMQEGETRNITVTTIGKVPPSLAPGSSLYLNGAWYIVAVVNGDRQYKLYKDPVVAVVQ